MQICWEVPVEKIGMWLKTAAKERDVEELKAEGWQGLLLTERWEDQEVGDEWLSWMSEWKTAPTHTRAELQELYQQLLPTKVYHHKKTGTNTGEDVKCRMCGKAAETQAHVLAGCAALAQSKYMIRHNAAFKVIFYELLKDLDSVTTVPPWYSQNMPKPLYENKRGKALWDIPRYAEHAEARNNRIDCTVIDKERKKVVSLEMSCPWVSNGEIKCAEKTNKYAPLRYELRRRFPEYKIEQQNIIIDALGGSSRRVNIPKIACYPGYLRNMFSFWSVSCSLRGNCILSLPSTKTTTYGLHSFSYMASKLWNSLPDSLRMSDFLDFKCKILQYDSFS
ncbi:hypothetical protein AWC38_SpisGene4639 [Stylophora pistillata]|uniref:Reverse transcriptase zinc-binding domain-containing protein n=1 Tax=Stylophora pistillata TaxID=50429 RepID=A0A2B4SN55_STYPI|nr:hypothetical protein AWC38_SpisGene4639 [Stylophora pistillata]